MHARPRGGEIRVLIVDGQRARGEALSVALGESPGMRSCGGALRSLGDALHAVDEGPQPDVVLLDASLHDLDLSRTVRVLHDRCPGVRVVALVDDLTPTAFVHGLEAGVDVLVPTTSSLAQLRSAVRAGDPPGSAPTAEDQRPYLTKREQQILALLAEGVPVKQVAAQLHVSVHTCRGHVRALLRKFGVHSQLAAVVSAARLGLLPDLFDNEVGQYRPPDD